MHVGLPTCTFAFVFKNFHPIFPTRASPACPERVIDKFPFEFYYNSNSSIVKDGWDADKIRDNSDPSDVMDHPKYGMLYRVPVISLAKTREQSTSNKLGLLAGARRRALKRALSDADEPSDVLKLEDLERRKKAGEAIHPDVLLEAKLDICVLLL